MDSGERYRVVFDLKVRPVTKASSRSPTSKAPAELSPIHATVYDNAKSVYAGNAFLIGAGIAKGRGKHGVNRDDFLIDINGKALASTPAHEMWHAIWNAAGSPWHEKEEHYDKVKTLMHPSDDYWTVSDQMVADLLTDDLRNGAVIDSGPGSEEKANEHKITIHHVGSPPAGVDWKKGELLTDADEPAWFGGCSPHPR